MEAYTPQLVSIGPIHHNNSSLRRMEDEKKRLKRKFTERTSKDLVEKFEKDIKEDIGKISGYYDGDYSNGYSLENIIVLDAIFILEVFLMWHEDQDDFLVKRQTWNTVVFDLRLLENQIPYFVLEKLCQEFENPNILLELALGCLFGWDLSRDSLQNILHFTDLGRRVLLKMFPQPSDGSPLERRKYIPSATKLQALGVELIKCINSIQVSCTHEDRQPKLFPFIKTKQLVLRIPHLKVDDSTESLLRNVMAFEQSHYKLETHICNFIIFMDFLIDTKKDVDLLVEKGILENNLGDNVVIATMFNRIGLQITLSRWHYGGVVKKLREHNEKPWNHAKATLRRVYFIDPWKGTATVAATVLLIFTLIQTVCSVIQTVNSIKQVSLQNYLLFINYFNVFFLKNLHISKRFTLNRQF